ncbi:hypothetical protein ENBRE01_3396, partial [Enteropsectra breve]
MHIIVIIMAVTKRKIQDENRRFLKEWTEYFAFAPNSNWLPICLICHEELAHNKKSNLERHFKIKHAAFITKYPASDARIKAIEELLSTQKNLSTLLAQCMNSSHKINLASFIIGKEILKRGKPFTDSEYIKHALLM